MEFTFEEFGFYDIKRWKILLEILINVKRMNITEIKIKDLDAGTITSTWHQINYQNREVSKKKCWIPITTEGLKKLLN